MLSLQNNQGHLTLFGKCLSESKELILKCIKLQYVTSEIMSLKCLREWSQFVHLKVKLLSSCDFCRVNHSTSFVTHTLADIVIFHSHNVLH